MRTINLILAAAIALTPVVGATAADAKPVLKLMKAKSKFPTAADKFQSGGGGEPIVYPTCPDLWQLKQRGAHIFVCYFDASPEFVDSNITYALGFDCDPWNGNPTISQQPFGNQIRLRWKCTN